MRTFIPPRAPVLSLVAPKPGPVCCDRLSRRDFLTAGALGLGGITLADVLGADGKAASGKSVIMICLAGGPSHIDMYDMKPTSPIEFRGEFRPARTNVPGFDICELMPEQARIADKLAVIRSLTYTNDINGHLLHELTTGFNRKQSTNGPVPDRPPMGAVISRLQGMRDGVPPQIAMGGSGGLGDPFDPLYLGYAHRPFQPFGEVSRDLALTKGVSLEKFQERRQLLSAFDTMRRDVDTSGALAGMDEFTRKAGEMIVSNQVRDALDLGREPERVRRRYSQEPDSSVNGSMHLNLLMARRLVEAGVRLVTVVYYSGHWDTHSNNFKTMRDILPRYDRAISALISDLYERGLDRDVAVVVWGEFGRSPKIAQGSFNGGRNHWPEAGFALLSGGGFKTGQMIGESDAIAARPKSRPYRPTNVLANLYQHLGIDPVTTLPDHMGRPQYLLDDREPVAELM